MENVVNPAAARLELAIWQSDAESMSSSDLYIWLRESGLPPEVAIRIMELVDVTAKIGEKIVNLGKIVVLKLIEFIKTHPNMATGVALGAAVAAMISTIPLIGPILAPIALVLGVGVGAIAGHRLDKSGGKSIDKGIDAFSVTQDVIEIARNFFHVFAETMRALGAELQVGGISGI